MKDYPIRLPKGMTRSGAVLAMNQRRLAVEKELIGVKREQRAINARREALENELQQIRDGLELLNDD